jgi:hypothetical protein
VSLGVNLLCGAAASLGELPLTGLCALAGLVPCVGMELSLNCLIVVTYLYEEPPLAAL